MAHTEILNNSAHVAQQRFRQVQSFFAFQIVTLKWMLSKFVVIVAAIHNNNSSLEKSNYSATVNLRISYFQCNP